MRNFPPNDTINTTSFDHLKCYAVIHVKPVRGHDFEACLGHSLGRFSDSGNQNESVWLLFNTNDLRSISLMSR